MFGHPQSRYAYPHPCAHAHIHTAIWLPVIPQLGLKPLSGKICLFFSPFFSMSYCKNHIPVNVCVHTNVTACFILFFQTGGVGAVRGEWGPCRTFLQHNDIKHLHFYPRLQITAYTLFVLNNNNNRLNNSVHTREESSEKSQGDKRRSRMCI